MDFQSSTVASMLNIRRGRLSASSTIPFLFGQTMDAEEGREEERVNLADDPSNRAMVQIDDLLPLDVWPEILSRLSITSLTNFKATSRAAYALIAGPRLPLMFRNRVSNSNPCLILFNNDSDAIPPCQLYFVDGEDCSGRGTEIKPPHHTKVNNLVSSCNGLLCLSLIGGSSESLSLLIRNPFVGDAVRVPPANRFWNEREVFGFGFHPRTGEFKVVRIYGVDDESMVQVFTVGTTEWRKKGALPPQLRDEIGPPGALVEGSLHWVTDVGIGGAGVIYGIISFELADEEFKVIPYPTCQRFVSCHYTLSVLNGRLAAARSVDTSHFDIWVMMQYGDRESWVKQFSFDPYLREIDEWRRYSTTVSTVICALKNGEILLQNKDSSLVSYDPYAPVENRFKTLQIRGILRNQILYRFQAFPFLPSLFSAKATMNLQL